MRARIARACMVMVLHGRDLHMYSIIDTYVCVCGFLAEAHPCVWVIRDANLYNPRTARENRRLRSYRPYNFIGTNVIPRGPIFSSAARISFARSRVFKMSSVIYRPPSPLSTSSNDRELNFSLFRNKDIAVVIYFKLCVNMSLMKITILRCECTIRNHIDLIWFWVNLTTISVNLAARDIFNL